jgi:photosystem II stability/assembly factor-like uncharacterized protein
MKTYYFNRKNFTQKTYMEYLRQVFMPGIFFLIKKSRKLLEVIVLLAFIIPCFTYGQVTYDAGQKWQWLHPKPQGNPLYWCKMWDKNTWYMAGDKGTFMKTSDGGSSWVITYNASRLYYLSPIPYKGTIFDAHFFNQNTGIVVGQYSSAYKTTNRGATFDSIPDLVTNDFSNWNSIYFLNNNTGYVTGHNNRLAKTTNGGGNWTYITSVPGGYHYDLWTPDANLIIVCSGEGKIHRSTNSGADWETINTSTSIDLRKLCFINNDTGFVSGTSGAVYLTTNCGVSWASANSGLPLTGFFDIDYKTAGQNTEVYLTGNSYFIYKTTNYGVTWNPVEFWASGQSYMGGYMTYASTELGGGDTLLTVGNMGLINKRNSGSERILYTNYLKLGGTGTMNDIWLDGSKIWVVGSATESGGPIDDQILFSSDDGSTWVKQSTGGTTASFGSIWMMNSNTGYVAGSNGEIRKTVNGGTSWDLLNSGIVNTLYRIEFVNQNTGWVFGAQASIYKTTNGGDNWVHQSAPVSGGSKIVSSYMVDENTGWFGGSVTSSPAITILCKTTDGGATWQNENHNVNGPGRTILGIKMVDNNTGYFGGFRNFCKTTNGGVNWDSLALPYPSYQITGIDFINEQTGMLLDCFRTLKTTNGAASWIIDEIGTDASYTATGPTRLKMVSGSTAYLTGAWASVMKYTGSPIGIIEWETGVPEKYELFQNYPNPFNPSTTIKFTVPRQGNVSLKVYDITGKEVRTIINNLSLNPGTVKHAFDGAGLASGVYFYSLYVDDGLISTKKMILLK